MFGDCRDLSRDVQMIVICNVKQTAADGTIISVPSDDLIVFYLKLLVWSFPIKMGLCNCQNVEAAYAQQQFYFVNFVSEASYIQVKSSQVKFIFNTIVRIS